MAKSKITHKPAKWNRVYPTGPYKDMADAVMGRTRGNLGRVIVPKVKPKITPVKFRENKPDPNYKPSTGWRVGP